MRIHALVLAAACAAAGAQQPNSAAASAVWNGVDGPAWPIVLAVDGSGGSTCLVVGGAPLRPFAVAFAPAGVLAVGAPTPFGTLDLDLSQGVVVEADGISHTTGS